MSGVLTLPPPGWPDALAPEAFHGLAGEVVRAIAPHTEADESALLLQLLVAFGSVIGQEPHFYVDGARHQFNEFVVLVGETSKARKGSSWGRVLRFLELGLQDLPDGLSWLARRIGSGLSSGEGLVFAVRDKTYRADPKTGEPVLDDPGEDDKRLLVYEPELSAVLRRVEREGNALSAVLRQAWDGGYLGALTKTSHTTTRRSHVCVVGHVVLEELRRYLSMSELAGGFGNRFIFNLVRRQRLLPRGGGQPDFGELPAHFRDAVATAVARDWTRGLPWAESTWAVWECVYPSLSEGKHGLFGALVARGEAHVARLAGLYALLDGAPVVRPEHLLAALAIWDRAEATARYVFGNALGDPIADSIWAALRGAGPEGMTRSELHAVLGRHAPAAELSRALGVLANGELVTKRETRTAGRTAEAWVATAATGAGETQVVSYLAIAEQALAALSSLDSLDSQCGAAVGGVVPPAPSRERSESSESRAAPSAGVAGRREGDGEIDILPLKALETGPDGAGWRP